MPVPDVAVVILNWNGRGFLEKFLPGVVEHSAPHRVVVADNASSDDSVDFVQKNFPSVEIVINESNGGFAKGYNDALKRITADYYVLLNSDVEVTKDWLEPLIKSLENPEIAGCQPIIRSYHRRDEFEHAGAAGGFIDAYYFPFCRGRLFDIIEKDRGQYDFPTRIFWTTGACMMIRSEVYHAGGGLDERFFAHMEEIDLCWRAQRMGHHFECVSESVVYHVGGGTLSYNSPRKTFLNFRNSLLMIHKNHPRAVYWMLFRRLCIDGAAAAMFIVKGQFSHFRAVFMAHISFYDHFPSSLRERRKLKGTETKADTGKYRGSILFAKYIRGIRSFSQLNQRRINK